MRGAMWSSIGRFGQFAAGRLRVRSALNPILWLCAVAVPICFGGAYEFRDDIVIRDLLIVVGVFPVLVACWCSMYFALRKPEKLQSEDYQLRHESLQIIQQQGGEVHLTAASLEAIANPSVHALEERREEAE